jgi:exopolysaccharide biosynthesis polyprenyl glycosylphosphotransferase
VTQRSKKIILIFGDGLVLYLALWFTLLIRYQVVPDAERWLQHLGPFTILFLIWLLIFYISGLYAIAVTRNNAKFFILLSQSMLTNAAIGAIFFYLTPFVDISPKTNFVISLVLSTLLLVFWRQFFNRVVGSKSFQTNTLIIGESTEVAELIHELDLRPQLGYKIIKQISPSTILSDPNFDLKDLVHKYQVKTIAVEPLSLHSQTMVDQLFKIISLRLRVVDLANFAEEISGKIPVQTIGQAWFLENLNLGRQNTYEQLKRLFDLITALLILVVSIWFWPLVALAIKATSPGPVLFKQKRIGFMNQGFMAIKFRTMVEEADKYGPEWAKPGDPRITKLGRLMRKTRIDEIPQLWNIIRNEMSFVGPRPERPEFVSRLRVKIPFYDERHLVKPGLTGWDQISGTYHSASPEDTLEKLQYDLYYIKNRSLVLDLAIILKTIKTIISRSGT